MNKKCQVFTPQDYVEKLLDSVDYMHDLYGKKILENSCGDGNILAVAVKRYIEDCRSNGLSKTKIRNGLQKDIFGVEIDKEQYENCVLRLNSIVAETGISHVKWQIFNEDFLKRRDGQLYDFIVGNPPYITYSEIEKEDRDFLRDNFISCKKGKFDYCYAFLEKSIRTLSANGRMAYLIPSSIYKTVFGDGIRTIMQSHVEAIEDYTTEKVFEEALVKSSIVILSNSPSSDNIHYYDEAKGRAFNIDRNRLSAKWFFDEIDVLGKRFGDYFKVSHVVATLCNDAYVLKKWSEDSEGNYIVDGCEIEGALVRDAASPRAFSNKKKEKIIFPYSYKDGKLTRYTEQLFSEMFPGASNYLNGFRKRLDKRDKDSNTSWFEYGRSQALNSLDCEKALISTVVSQEISIYKLGKECIPYAGMYIKPITDEMSVDDGISILQNDKFLKYVKTIGIPINGESVRITSKDIEEYLF